MDINKLEPLSANFQSIELLERVAKDYIPDKAVFPLGFPIFDYAMDNGLRGGELITISAQTGEGKTTFCQQLTGNFIKQNIPCLWFTYEMNPYYLNEKFVKMQIMDSPIYVPNTEISGQLDEIEYRIKGGFQDYACKIVFIDHLHYLVPLIEAKNTSLLIGGIVRELKKMAVRHSVIIFLIAHTKKIYQGEDVNLSSIRDSSLVAQESDYVFLLQRKKKENKKNQQSNDTEWLNETKISLAKNRRTGELRFITCLHENHKFVEITKEYAGITY